jgi:hypothetical protein
MIAGQMKHLKKNQIFRMIAEQDQTLKKKSSFLNCLAREDEGVAIFRNVGKHLPDD